MNYKKQNGVLLLISGIIPVISFLVTEYPNQIGLCKIVYGVSGEIQGRSCLFELGFLQPLFFLSFVAFIFLIPLYFLKEAVYLSWRKFAVWYLPIVAILILLAGSSGGNGFNPGYGMDSESLTFFFSGLFAIISFILIIYKSIKLRGK